jgi:hypothetical protein
MSFTSTPQSRRIAPNELAASGAWALGRKRGPKRSPRLLPFVFASVLAVTTRFECPRCQTVFTRDRGDDDAFVECPSCGAMAMSVGEATDALARQLSSTHDVGGFQDRTLERSDEDDNDDDSGVVHRPEPSLVGALGAGVFSGLLGQAPEPASPPPVGSLDLGLDLGLDDELRDFELPATAPGNAALSPQKKTAPKVRAKTASAPPARTADAPPPDVKVSLDNDALDALGAAFDSMALRPSQQRGADGLSDDERRFLRADAPAAVEARPPPRKPPPRPPGKPGERRQAPPPRARKPAGPRPVSKGIALSAEARDAAFIPLKTPQTRPAAAPAPRPAVVADEQTVPAASTPATLASARPDATELLARPKRLAPREAPTVLSGISRLAMAAAVLLGLVGGGVAGAATAPSSTKRNDARARAEAQLAEGNRFYQVGRFDDALGAYKAALNNDRAFAVAHRAKGSALASNKRYDEAAEAYRDYLALEPSAIDASDIKEALTRRGLTPVSGAADGR